MTNKINLTIIIPAFNEEKGISRVIKEVQSVMTDFSYELIIVNDGSTDNTAKILSHEKVNVINHIQNKGYGASLKTGIKAAKGDWILITDADGTYPIKDIPKLLKYTDKYDMIVGARVGKNVHIPVLRSPAKKIISILANFLSGKKIPDINSGLRAFKKNIALEFFHLFPSGFSFTTTITLACLTNDYEVKYVPINYYKRKGKSTIHPIKDFVRFLNLIVRIIAYFNPFKIFFTISTTLFFLSIIIFFYSFFFLGKIMDNLVLGFFLSSLQVFLFGIVADLIVKERGSKKNG